MAYLLHLALRTRVPLLLRGRFLKRQEALLDLDPCQLIVDPYPIQKGISSREGKCYLDRRLY